MSDEGPKCRKKLIEVALPLEALNEGSKPETENPFLKGHPRAIHNWWARTPLSVCRAVLFAQLVDDPGEGLEPDKAEKAREPLLDLVRRLGTWDAIKDARLIAEARKVLDRQFGGEPPAVWDMFAGRGSISIEAQRLGLRVYTSDVNPVAVTIQKALLQYTQEFVASPPVNVRSQGVRSRGAHWHGKATEGLREDIAVYGEWVRRQALERIGHLYPRVLQHGSEVTVGAWLWTRTVICPNPACRARMPLVRSFTLSTKKGKEAWVEPVVCRTTSLPTIRFEIMTGKGKPPEGTKQRRQSKCLFCGSDSISDAALRDQATRHGLGTQLMAVVAESPRGRVYLAPEAASIPPVEVPDAEWLAQLLPDNARWFSPPMYGLETYRDLFAPRQLLALATFADLVAEAQEKVLGDAQASGFAPERARSYADAIATYLACALSRMTDYHCALSTWNPTNENVRNMFQRQAIPMAWDFAEANPLEGKLDFAVAARWVAESLEAVPSGSEPAKVFQHDARSSSSEVPERVVVSTDPPYYDNIGYADLSDFFYVWLRKMLRACDPETFRTVLTPKAPELIASPYRHDGSDDAAESHFRQGFASAFRNLRHVNHEAVPMTVYYAYKQSETESDSEGNGSSASTGWETMLEGLVNEDFVITGTWPVRTTKKARSVARNTNALASAIVIVCRERVANAQVASRREFTSALKRELPEAVKTLQHENIPPVDLAQAAIGPGMAVFSRYREVLEADDTRMPVHEALRIINAELDTYLSEQEGDYDSWTRFAITWFQQHGFSTGPFGDANTIANGKNVSVQGVVGAGILEAKAGKVRLLRRDELPDEYVPFRDNRQTVWEGCQHLIKRLEGGDTEQGAARLAKQLGYQADMARNLAHRLYQICERNKWAEEARAYNALGSSWREIIKIRDGLPDETTPGPAQSELGV